MSYGLRATLLALCTASALSVPCMAQSPDPKRSAQERALYMRAMARVFATTPAEVELLADWLRHPSELPVLLHLARRAGVSPDIVGSLRRSGSSWQRLAIELGLSAAVFHVEVAGADIGGVLARPLREFRDRPAGEWYAIALTDMEIVALVNLRVISEASSTSAANVAVALDSPAPDYLSTYAVLIRGRMGTCVTDS